MCSKDRALALLNGEKMGEGNRRNRQKPLRTILPQTTDYLVPPLDDSAALHNPTQTAKPIYHDKPSSSSCEPPGVSKGLLHCRYHLSLIQAAIPSASRRLRNKSASESSFQTWTDCCPGTNRQPDPPHGSISRLSSCTIVAIRKDTSVDLGMSWPPPWSYMFRFSQKYASCILAGHLGSLAP